MNWQQDGAKVHRNKKVLKYLNGQFGSRMLFGSVQIQTLCFKEKRFGPKQNTNGAEQRKKEICKKETCFCFKFSLFSRSLVFTN